MTDRRIDNPIINPRPSTGRIAIKVINHYGDEIVQVFEVS